MSSHGEDSGIVVILLVRIVGVTLHLLEPDLVHDDIDGRRIVPVGKTDAEGGDRSRHGLALGLQSVNHEERLVPNHAVMCVGYRSWSIFASCPRPGLLAMCVSGPKRLVAPLGHRYEERSVGKERGS